MRKELLNVIKEWKKESRVRSIILINANCTDSKVLTICTSKPGLMIGKKGVMINKYLTKIKEIAPNIENVEFVETDSWYIR